MKLKLAKLTGLFLVMAMLLVSLVLLVQPAEAGDCAYVHVVRYGESLSVIAARYGVNMWTLARYNGITNLNRVYAGMRLCIPGAAPPSGACRYHTVQRGQTLSWIARYYGVDKWTLARRNGITNLNRIYVGQRLLISCPAPAPRPTSTPSYYPPPPQPGDPPALCSVELKFGFGRLWYGNANVRSRLGCPMVPESGFHATEQAFYRGYVVLDGNARVIYLIFNDGTWLSYPDTWQPGDPVTNPRLVPPAGWYQPEYGIGKVWRNENNISQRLGWARYPQRSDVATQQRFEHGLMLWVQSRGIYVLYDTGRWQRFN